MTGFGKAIGQFAGKKITVEIRSLNSKGLDLNARIASLFREKELDIRKIVGAALNRGKVDINIYAEVTGIESASSINMDLAKAYLEQLTVLEREAATKGDLIARGSIFRPLALWNLRWKYYRSMPSVLETEQLADSEFDCCGKLQHDER